ncbi:MAG: nitrate- and nitrite sensing domain-containing protein, partial [Thalassolituus sp.]
MTQATVTSEDFLLAAKKGELCALRQLLISCGLVTRVTELIHELQRERGLSNIYLVSDGQRYSQQRLDELTATDLAERNFREAITALKPEEPSAASVRLFSSIAFVLHRLESLPALREQVTSKQINATENTQIYSRLVAGLLAVVFEAADISDDPDITRALVAMFNFVQGKEYAGQERAWGLIGYTAGTFSSKLQERMQAVQEAQRLSFDVYTQIARTIPQAQWRQLESDEATHELSRLRLMIDRFRSGDSLPTAISEVWYEIATRRIDAMQTIEKDLASELLTLCEAK